MNRELLREAYLYSVAHPEEHDQSYFYYIDRDACGTSACIGGRALLLAGYQLRYRDDNYDYPVLEVVTPSGRAATNVASAAVAVCGLTEEQADELFFNAGDLYEVAQVLLDWGVITEHEANLAGELLTEEVGT